MKIEICFLFKGGFLFTGARCESKKFCQREVPGDFVTNVKQTNSQSDLTSMSSFAGPSYITVRSFLYIF